ncbi:TniQ family protein [Bradyrhizobium yuanmingense]|uniref:TniQ family protein n=1 Tax=Bradyrhizobium yuanmingense TaxID=108015 RepID=UPI0012F92F60|nr:TniQ family protein [Bradyrhizobium yuanmingense]
MKSMTTITGLARLNASVPLWPDEPAYALASRLARRNGVNSLESFGGDHGIPLREILHGHRNAEIAVLAGAKLFELDKATFRIAGKGERIWINNEVLHRDDWSHASLRICPNCLQGDLERQDSRRDFLPHIRSWWNLVRISVCPIHAVELVECDRADAPSLKNGHLQFDVRFAAGPQCDFTKLRPKRIADVRAETYILGRLGFMARLRSPVLDGLPLWNAIRLMDRMGAVAAAGIRGYTSFGGSVDQREALAAGYGVFANGKESFFRFLDGLVDSAEIRNGKWGPRAVYGRVYEWLSYETRDGAYDPVRELVREHALNNIPLAPHDLLFGKPVRARRVYTLWHASRAIGVSVSNPGRRIFRALGYLSPDDEAKPEWKILLRSAVVNETREQISDRMNYNEAMRYLGLPRGPMLNLYEKGILKPFLDVSMDLHEHIFRQRDLDRFVDSVIGDAPSIEGATSSTCNIVIAGKRSQTSTAEILEALLSGRLRCKGRLRSAKGLMKVLVDLVEVKTLRDCKAAIDLSKTIDACRKQLGVTCVVMERLIALGYIKISYAKIGLRNRQRGLVNEQSFRRFVATYARGTEIAKLRRTHVRTLVPELRRLGVRPAIEKRDVGQYFYRRVDLPKAFTQIEFVEGKSLGELSR